MGTKLGARDYTDAAVQASVTDEQAFKSIKEGMKKDEKTLMKPSELSAEDIKASVAYLRETAAVHKLTSPAEMGELFKVLASSAAFGNGS